MATKGSSYITGPVSMTSGSPSTEQLASNIVKNYAASKTAKLQRDAIQQALFDKENLAYSTMYSKLDQIPEVGLASLDKNINSFFNDQADKIFDLKQYMKNGDISLKEGNKAIAQLTGYIDTYAELAPQFQAQAQYMKDAMKDGSLSRVNADGLQLMMMGIADNSGDIEILEKDGELYLSGKGKIDTQDGKEDWNYNINIKEFKKLVDEEGYSVARTVPNIKDIGIDAIFEANKATVKGAVSYDKRYNKKTKMDEYIEVYDPVVLEELLVGRGVFNDLMNGDEMDTIWADVINRSQSAEWLNKEEEGKKINQWDPNSEKMVNQAERWFANEAVKRNIPPDQIKSMKERQIEEVDDSSVSVGSGVDVYTTIVGMVDEVTRKATAPGQFHKAQINLKSAAKYLTQSAKEKEFFSLEKEENLQTIANQLDKTIEEVKEIIRNEQVEQGGGNPLIAYINEEKDLVPLSTSKFDGTIKGMLSTVRDYAGLGQKSSNEIFAVMNNISQFGGDIQKFHDWYDLTGKDDKKDKEIFSIYLGDTNSGPSR